MQGSRRPACAIGLAAASLLAAAGTAQAQLSGADVGVNPTYERTGPGPADVTSTGGFFSARVFFMNPGDYTGGTVTFPVGGSGSLTSEGANVIGYGASNTSLSQFAGRLSCGRVCV
jgi:hypothetical protein